MLFVGEAPSPTAALVAPLFLSPPPKKIKNMTLLAFKRKRRKKAEKMPEAKSGAQASHVSQRPSKLTGLVKSIGAIGAKVDSAKVATVAKRTGVAIVCTMVAVAIATVVGIMSESKQFGKLMDKLPKAAQTILFWNMVIVGGCVALLCVFLFLAAAAGSGSGGGLLFLS